MLNANVPAEAATTTHPHILLPKIASNTNVNIIDKCIKTYQWLFGDKANALCDIIGISFVIHNIPANNNTDIRTTVLKIFMYLYKLRVIHKDTIYMSKNLKSE